MRATYSPSTLGTHLRHPGIGREQDLGALELAGRMPAAAQQRLELDALGFAQLDAVAYVHRASPLREAQMNQSRGDVRENLHRPALTLERLGLIRRRPGAARSIEVLLAPEHLPVLRHPEPVKSSVPRI